MCRVAARYRRTEGHDRRAGHDRALDHAQLLDFQVHCVAGLEPWVGLRAVHRGELEDAAGADSAATDDVTGAQRRAAGGVGEELSEPVPLEYSIGCVTCTVADMTGAVVVGIGRAW